MKLVLTSMISIALLMSFPGWAIAANPQGDITFYNKSPVTISGQVSNGVGSFQLASNEEKTISYSVLSQICSDAASRCIARFYANSKPAGTATFNVTTGTLVNIHTAGVKVHTVKANHVVRSVIIT